jgi:hypothetical protein
MTRWDRDAPPRYEVPLRDDIPLQTPMGNYHKPFWKKHGWTLGPTAAVILLGLIAAFVTPDAQGSPTVIMKLSTDGPIPLSLSEKQLKAKYFFVGRAREVKVNVTNRGDSRAQFRIASMPGPPAGVTICWRLGLEGSCSHEQAGVVQLGVIAPGETVTVVARIQSDNTDSSTFVFTVIFVSSPA